MDTADKSKFELLKSFSPDPADLEVKPLGTIEELEYSGKLPDTIKPVIESLNLAHPKMTFNNVTPSEAIKILEYTEEIKKLSRMDIWIIIKPYFGAVFHRDLGDLHSKMREIEKRSEHNPNYVPTMEWLQQISKRILDGRKDLFDFNIDFNIRMFEHRNNPIEFLLLLIKTKKDMFPKRKDKGINPEAYFPKFKLIMQNHSELLLKLKTNNKTGSDFFGSRYSELDNNLRMFKSLMYRAFCGTPLSQEHLFHIFELKINYEKTLSLLFMVDLDDKALFEAPFIRPIKNVKFAALDIYYIFSDGTNITNQYKNIPSSENGHKNIIKPFGKSKIKRIPGITASEIINRIYIKSSSQSSLPYTFQQGISIIHLEEYITEYFSFDEKQRCDEMQKVLELSKPHKFEIVINYFFEILNKYI